MVRRTVVNLAVLILSCAEPKPLPNVIRPPPSGPRPHTVAGPMPDFGPFANVDDAINAACPFMLNQPHAVIPVRKGDQDFDVYWRTADEYCAWLYGVEGKSIRMSLLMVSAAQDNPKLRQCELPPYVADRDYTPDSIAYLVIIHNHPYDAVLTDRDLRFLAQMAQLHGFASSINGRQIPISIVGFIGRMQAGQATCAGFYQYSPLPDSELTKITIDPASGVWRRALIGHVRWNEDLTFTIEP